MDTIPEPAPEHKAEEPEAESKRKPKHLFTHENASEMGKRQKGIKKRGTGYYLRKWCNPGCPFWDRCPVIMMALAQDPADKHGHRLCYVKGLPQDKQNLFRNIFEEGEFGLIKVISDLYFTLILRAKSKGSSYRDLKDAVETSLEMMKTLYGDKKRLDISGSLVQIIDDIPRQENNVGDKNQPQ